MRRWKKRLSLFMSAVMLAGSVQAPAYADESVSVQSKAAAEESSTDIEDSTETSMQETEKSAESGENADSDQEQYSAEDIILGIDDYQDDITDLFMTEEASGETEDEEEILATDITIEDVEEVSLMNSQAQKAESLINAVFEKVDDTTGKVTVTYTSQSGGTITAKLTKPSNEDVVLAQGVGTAEVCEILEDGTYAEKTLDIQVEPVAGNTDLPRLFGLKLEMAGADTLFNGSYAFDSAEKYKASERYHDLGNGNYIVYRDTALLISNEEIEEKEIELNLTSDSYSLTGVPSAYDDMSEEERAAVSSIVLLHEDKADGNKNHEFVPIKVGSLRKTEAGRLEFEPPEITGDNQRDQLNAMGAIFERSHFRVPLGGENVQQYTLKSDLIDGSGSVTPDGYLDIDGGVDGLDPYAEGTIRLGYSVDYDYHIKGACNDAEVDVAYIEIPFFGGAGVKFRTTADSAVSIRGKSYIKLEGYLRVYVFEGIRYDGSVDYDTDNYKILPDSAGSCNVSTEFPLQVSVSFLWDCVCFTFGLETGEQIYGYRRTGKYYDAQNAQGETIKDGEVHYCGFDDIGCTYGHVQPDVDAHIAVVLDFPLIPTYKGSHTFASGSGNQRNFHYTKEGFVDGGASDCTNFGYLIDTMVSDDAGNPIKGLTIAPETASGDKVKDQCSQAVTDDNGNAKIYHWMHSGETANILAMKDNKVIARANGVATDEKPIRLDLTVHMIKELDFAVEMPRRVGETLKTYTGDPSFITRTAPLTDPEYQTVSINWYDSDKKAITEAKNNEPMLMEISIPLDQTNMLAYFEVNDDSFTLQNTSEYPEAVQFAYQSFNVSENDSLLKVYYTVIMDKPKYSVTTEFISQGGTVTPAAQVVDLNDDAVIEVQLDEGFEITEATAVYDSDPGNPVEIVFDGNNRYTFQKVQCDISAAITADVHKYNIVPKVYTMRGEEKQLSGEGGSVEPTPAELKYGDESTISFLPTQEEGVTWKVKEASYTNDAGEKVDITDDAKKGQYVLKTTGMGLSRDIPVEATFEADPHQITAEVVLQHIDGSETIVKGEDVTEFINVEGARVTPNMITVDHHGTVEFQIEANQFGSDEWHISSILLYKQDPSDGENLTEQLDRLTHVLSLEDVRRDYRLRVEFAAIPHEVSGNVIGGNGTISEEVEVEDGENAAFIITPETGYHVSQVMAYYHYGSLRPVAKDVTTWISNNQLTFEKVRSTIRFEVVFERNKYTVNYDANGRDADVPGTQIKTHGIDMKLSERIPEEQHSIFLGWNTDPKATAAIYQPGDTFKEEGFTVLYAIWADAVNVHAHVTGGDGTVEPLDKKIWKGDSVSFKIVPKSDPYVTWFIKQVTTKTQSGVETDVTQNVKDHVLTLTSVQEDTEVSILFEAEPHTVRLIVSGEDGGRISAEDGEIVNNEIKVPHHGNQSFWLIPMTSESAPWYVKSVVKSYGSLEEGEDITETMKGDKLTLSNVSRDTNLYITFDNAPHLITGKVVDKSANVHGRVEAPKYAAHGEPLTYTIYTDAGYEIVLAKAKYYYTFDTPTVKDVTAMLQKTQGSEKGDWKLTIDSVECRMELEITVVPVTYKLTYDGNGGTHVPLTAYKKHDEPIEVTSEKPFKEGYRFLGWSKNQYARVPSYVGGDVYSENADATFYAVWQSTVTVVGKHSEGGMVTPASPIIDRGADTEVRITPVVAPGVIWRIKSVVVYTAENPNSRRDMTKDVVDGVLKLQKLSNNTVVDAVFEADPHIIGVTVDGEEGGKVTPDTTSVKHHDNLTFTIQPLITGSTYWHVEQIIKTSKRLRSSEDITAQLHGTTLTFENITEDFDLYVKFSAEPHTLKGTVTSGNGTVSPDEQKVIHHGTAAFAITPDADYNLHKVTAYYYKTQNAPEKVDVTEQVQDGTLSLTDVTCNVTIEAEFSIKQYTILATVDGYEGSVTPEISTVNIHESAEITIKPDNGFHVKKVTYLVGEEKKNITKQVKNNQLVLEDITADGEVIITFAGKGSSDPVPHGGGSSPSTGDPTQTGFWYLMLILSAWVLAFTYRKKTKQNKK